MPGHSGAAQNSTIMGNRPDHKHIRARALERIMRDVLGGMRNFTTQLATAGPDGEPATGTDGNAVEGQAAKTASRVVPFRRETG